MGDNYRKRGQDVCRTAPKVCHAGLEEMAVGPLWQSLAVPDFFVRPPVADVQSAFL